MTMKSRTDDNFMNEGMDIRRFFLCLFRKIWIFVIALVIGAIAGGAAYKLYYAITDSDVTYKISTDYHIEFNEKDYPNGMDYFNAYTWNQFVTDDKIVDYALANSEGLTAEDIKSSVTALMMSDYRILTVVVTSTDTDKLNAINEVYKEAMPYFAECFGELSSIELWSCDDMVVANVHDKTVNAAILGAIIALVLFGFGYMVYCCMDDRIYVEDDFTGLKTGITCLGYDCPDFAEDTAHNRKEILGDAKLLEFKSSMKPEEAGDYEGVVLNVTWGSHATAVKYTIDLLSKRNIRIYGAVITDCNEKFLKAYYGFGKK